jgi:chitinase
MWMMASAAGASNSGAAGELASLGASLMKRVLHHLAALGATLAIVATGASPAAAQSLCEPVCVFMGTFDQFHVEGNSGTTYAFYNVRLSHAEGTAVSVRYETAPYYPTGITATPDLDFGSVSGWQTFQPGETLKTIYVPIYGDLDQEYLEQFLFSLTAVQGGVFYGGGPFVLNTYLLDDDTLIAIGDRTMTEGNAGTTRMAFPVTLDRRPLQGEVSVWFSTANGSAVTGADYAATSGVLVFPKDTFVTTQHVYVTSYGDYDIERSEYFVLNLSSPTMARLADGLARGLITDDDSTTQCPKELRCCQPQ